jgi:hypothetical protein
MTLFWSLQHFQHIMEERFYRQLFLKRYALLLEKAERIYGIPKETMDILKRQVLSLDWVDPGVALLQTNASPKLP